MSGTDRGRTLDNHICRSYLAVNFIVGSLRCTLAVVFATPIGILLSSVAQHMSRITYINLIRLAVNDIREGGCARPTLAPCVVIYEPSLRH